VRASGGSRLLRRQARPLALSREGTIRELLVSTGIVFVAGAIVGGGLSAFEIAKLPLIPDWRRQSLLGVFGVFLLVLGLVTDNDGDDTSTTTTTIEGTTSNPRPSTTNGSTTTTLPSPGCRLTISNPFASINETPEHQGQESANVPAGVYSVLEITSTPFAGRDERWFKIEVGSRQGWILDDTILIASKSEDCP
jgi:hypothetical protein